MSEWCFTDGVLARCDVVLIWDWSEPDLPAEPFPAPLHPAGEIDFSRLVAGGDATSSVQKR